MKTRATNIVPNGNYAGQVVKVIYFTKNGLDLNVHDWKYFETFFEIKEVIDRLNSFENDEDSQQFWEQISYS